MAIDTGMLGSLAGMLQMLPSILSYAQVLVYVVAILFFGSIAVRGYKGFLAWHKRLLMRVLLGAISVVSGVSITPFLRIDNPLLRLAQIDMLAGMLISSLAMFVSLRLMTLNIPFSVVLKERIRRLQEQLEKRDDRNAGMPDSRIRHPATIAGLAVFIGFIAFSLLNFRGFPDMQKSMFSALGLSESDISAMAESIAQFQKSPLSNLSAGCMAALQGTQGKSDLFKNPPVYDNPALKLIIEQKSGEKVSEMYSIRSDGNVLVVSVGQKGRQCFATPSEFCICS